MEFEISRMWHWENEFSVTLSRSMSLARGTLFISFFFLCQFNACENYLVLQIGCLEKSSDPEGNAFALQDLQLSGTFHHCP